MKTSEILKSKENALHSMFNKAMFIPDGFCAGTKTVPDKDSVHK